MYSAPQLFDNSQWQRSAQLHLLDADAFSQIAWSDLQLGETRGAGASGIVWSGSYCGTDVAVKARPPSHCLAVRRWSD